MSATRLLARWRVSLGMVTGLVALWLAEPTWQTLAAGAAVAALGEALRLWAAGHIEKSREVTTSGPYRYARHPLYLGSALIGAGFAVAARSAPVATLAAGYLALTLTAAMRAEEAHLREKFGDAYDAYVERRRAPEARPWSWARARYNREHHTLAGVVAGLALLAIKAAV
ncbi:MAG: isoprenylcysteine carboxylmethyltransferase family protein [Acidobacteriota bacterium]